MYVIYRNPSSIHGYLDTTVDNYEEGPPKTLLRTQQHIADEVATEVISTHPLVSFIDMGLFRFNSVSCET